MPMPGATAIPSPTLVFLFFCVLAFSRDCCLSLCHLSFAIPGFAKPTPWANFSYSFIDVCTREEYEISHLPGAIWAEIPSRIASADPL
jgi:hypothetical protein